MTSDYLLRAFIWYFVNVMRKLYETKVACTVWRAICLICFLNLLTLVAFYAVLRSIPHKLGGVFAMFASLLVLLLLPYLNITIVRSSSFRPLHKQFYWIFVLNFCILSWIGGCAPETPYLEIGQIATCFYFAYFLFFIPFLGFLEKNLMLSDKRID